MSSVAKLVLEFFFGSRMFWGAVLCGLSLSATSASAIPIIIGFDDLVDGDIVTNQYSGLGFSNTIVFTAGFSLNEVEAPPHSGANVVTDNGGAIRITFAAPVRSASGFFTYVTPLTISAFDASSTLLGSENSAFSNNLAVSGDAGSLPNELIALNFSGIASVLISGDPAGSSFVLDDFTFEPADVQPPPPPSGIPEPSSFMLMAGFIGVWFASTKKNGTAMLFSLRIWVFARAAFGAALTTTIVALGSTAADAQTIQILGASPAAVIVNTPTNVVVTTTISDPSQISANSVVIQKVTASGHVLSILGSLHDDGINGDLIAGDSVYSGRISISESSIATVLLRASAGIRGSLRRAVSDTTTVEVLPVGMPTDLGSPSDLTQQVTDPNTGSLIVGNEVLACFQTGASANAIKAAATSIGGTLIGRLPSDNCYHIRLATSSAAAVNNAITSLIATGLVTAAQPNIISTGEQAISPCSDFPVCRNPPPAGAPDYSYVNIHLAAAHGISIGTGVTVAVIDSGLDLLNEPFKSDKRFVRGPNYYGPLGSDPQDDHGHGTAVASVVAATAPGANILSIRACKRLPSNHTGCGTWEQVFAIQYAKANAKGGVINFSNSSPGPDPMRDAEVTKALAAGFLFAAAAGNDGTPQPEYPARLPDVVSVAAVNKDDLRWAAVPSTCGDATANTSACGATIAAPGDHIPVFGLRQPNLGQPNDVVMGSGTSFATPFVAGVAALVFSKFRTLVTASDVRNQLINSAYPLINLPPPAAPKFPAPGRLDADAALGSIIITRLGLTASSSVTLTILGAGQIVLASQTFSLGGQNSSSAPPTTPSCTIRVPLRCVDSLPLGNLPPGSKEIRVRNNDTMSNLGIRIDLAYPGLAFTNIISGPSAGIVSPTQATMQLIAPSSRSASFGGSATLPLPLPLLPPPPPPPIIP